MKVLIVNFGGLCENIAATSVLKPLRDICENPEITWVPGNKESLRLLERNDCIDRALMMDDLVLSQNRDFDLFINLHPSFDPADFESIQYHTAKGFGFDDNLNGICDAMQRDISSKMTYLQAYFRLCGMRWSGNGYHINYHPRTKSKNNRAGLALANANLRDFIRNSVKTGVMKIWNIPRKQNVFKRIDEINKCSHIITDDEFTAHVAISFRKYVHFLRIRNYGFKMEYFNNGQEYEVPAALI